VVMSVAAQQEQPPVNTEQGNLVYCNLNDLDFNAGEGGVFTSLASAISSLTSQSSMQEGTMTMTSANSGFLQMVQAVPGLQLATNDKSPYSAVSTILLQGGILQLKSDSSGQVSNIVANPQHNQGEQLAQVLHIPIDSKLGAQELLRGGAERMLPSQTVTCGGGSVSRPQDAIASILASMNSTTGHTVTTLGGQTIIQTAGGQTEQAQVSLASPVDYSTQVQDVVNVVSGLGEERAEMVPLNLATGSQQVPTIQQPQSVQVQGFKRVAQATPGGGIITKKVIIATINGTQRILTPVSSPQMIAVKSNSGGPARILSDGTIPTNPGTPLTIIQQKPVQTKTVVTNPNTAGSSVSPQGVKSIDNKTCRWKFENGQICGKVFTKTYNLTVHMRMHQDIRPFPCTICEQTFRQKAHLQRHEATHGIDSTQGRKRRKKSLLEGLNESGILGGRRQGGRMSESEEEEGGDSLYRPFNDKRQKFSVGTMKTEADLDLDPMIEPIDGSTAGPRKMCPVTVGTNTDITPDVREETFVDELEEDMEPVRYRSTQQGTTTMQVEQGVQYCEADLLPQGGHFEQEDKFVPNSAQTSIDAPQVAAMQTQVSMSEFMGEEGGQVDLVDEEEGEGGKVMKTEMVYTTSQGGHYVSEGQEFIEQEQGAATHLLTADGSFIDASSNHLVMSDGGLVSLVNCVSGDTGEPQENVVNIVTSTATNEQGQQIVIIENLDQHSPELQREIMNALLADHTIVPISQ